MFIPVFFVWGGLVLPQGMTDKVVKGFGPVHSLLAAAYAGFVMLVTGCCRGSRQASILRSLSVPGCPALLDPRGHVTDHTMDAGSLWSRDSHRSGVAGQLLPRGGLSVWIGGASARGKSLKRSVRQRAPISVARKKLPAIQTSPRAPASFRAVARAAAGDWAAVGTGSPAAAQAATSRSVVAARGLVR